MIHDFLLVALWLAGALGCLFMLFAAALTWSSTRPQPAREPAPDLTILKPLHGDEAGLYENLASFCEQDYSGHGPNRIRGREPERSGHRCR